jgi:hypothetical protein
VSTGETLTTSLIDEVQFFGPGWTSADKVSIECSEGRCDADVSSR